MFTGDKIMTTKKYPSCC